MIAFLVLYKAKGEKDTLVSVLGNSIVEWLVTYNLDTMKKKAPSDQINEHSCSPVGLQDLDSNANLAMGFHGWPLPSFSLIPRVVVTVVKD